MDITEYIDMSPDARDNTTFCFAVISVLYSYIEEGMSRKDLLAALFLLAESYDQPRKTDFIAGGIDTLDLLRKQLPELTDEELTNKLKEIFGMLCDSIRLLNELEDVDTKLKWLSKQLGEDEILPTD